MDYTTLFLMLLAASIGLGAGILRQRAIDEAALDELAAENRQLRKHLAATLCRYRAKSHAVKRLQKFVDRNWYGDPYRLVPTREGAWVGEVDEYLMRDRSAQ